jgi:hypothetical protein
MSKPYIVIAKLENVPETVQKFVDRQNVLRQRLVSVFKALGKEIQTSASSAAPKRTGRLQRSSKLISIDNPKTIGAKIKFRAPYSRFVELGVDKTVQVKPYTRRYRPQDIKGSTTAKGGRPPTIAQGIIFIKGYMRHAHFKARPFLGPAVSIRRNLIISQVMEALRKD